MSTSTRPAAVPYPDVADVSHASPEAAQLFRDFFTAKSRHQVEATHAHFHPDQTFYADATLGWVWPTNADLRGVWEQYMPQWPAQALSYPTRILGDTDSALVLMTDTPELFGGEIRAAAAGALFGNDAGGGYEWRAAGGQVPRGVIALELDPAGQISRLTAVWDGALLDDDALSALTARVVER